MRVGYLIQSHRDPEQVARLVHTLRKGSPGSIVHVSHEVTAPPLHLDGVPGVYTRKAHGGYGDFSHVRRYLDAVLELVERRIEVDWVVNLTGQDYPIRPIADAEADLATNRADGYLEYFPALDHRQSNWPVHRARSRYLFRHHRVKGLSPSTMRRLRPLQAINRVQPIIRVHVAYGLTIGVRRPSPFGPDFVLYGGSAYSTLSWPCVAYLLDFCEARPDVMHYYADTLSPVESLVQTALVNSKKFKLVNNCKRYFDFRGSKLNHPRFLGLEDVPAMVASGYDFARKINDPAVLDLLDTIISPAQR
jgi:hypothetical protein